MSEEAKETRSMTADEIRQEIERLAREGEGADRRWALKKLSDQEGTNIVLPAPLTEAEMIKRVCRINRGAGLEMTRICFFKTFPHAKLDIVPLLSQEHVPEHIKAKVAKITSIKRLNRAFPEMKTAGCPRGYPRTGSAALKIKWCQDSAAARYLEREQEELDKTPEPPCPSS